LLPTGVPEEPPGRQKDLPSFSVMLLATTNYFELLCGIPLEFHGIFVVTCTEFHGFSFLEFHSILVETFNAS